MDTINIYIDGKSQAVNKKFVVDIENGKALMNTGRWHKIDCDQCETDYEQVDEADEPYIVCNRCNKVTYRKDLRP